MMALWTAEVNPLMPSWGILGFMLVLNAVLFIAALVSIARNKTHTTGGTIVWALIVLSIPVLGSILWFLVGRRDSGSRLRNLSSWRVERGPDSVPQPSLLLQSRFPKTQRPNSGESPDCR